MMTAEALLEEIYHTIHGEAIKLNRKIFSDFLLLLFSKRFGENNIKLNIKVPFAKRLVEICCIQSISVNGHAFSRNFLNIGRTKDSQK